MPEKSNIIKAVKKSILKLNMIQPGDKIIVAVSGGPDSICLLDILACCSKELSISLIIAHYNHGLRTEEDDLETSLVKDYSISLGLPFETEKASDLNMQSSSLEDRARNLRYDFFERIRVKYKAHKIALGHNLNDQAETVIMRLLRGSGMSGLSGIPPVRDRIIIRPLIEVKRENILAYLEQKHLKYATDSSNQDKRFLRNKIRLELLPEMMKYQPGFIETLGKLSDNLRDENSYLEDQTKKWVNEKLEQNTEGSFIDITLLKDLPEAFIKRIIRNIVQRHYKSLYGISSVHVKTIIDLMASTKPNSPIDLPGNLIVKKEYNRLIFTSQTPNPDSFVYEVNNHGELNIAEIGRKLMVEELDNNHQAPITNDTNIAYLNKELLPYPLTIRTFKPGDKFIPYGMTGHKKIKDFFIDLKISPVTRKQTPILLKDDRVVWICGYRIDDQYKVTSNTKRILKITLF